jgi:hypothetical protein
MTTEARHGHKYYYGGDGVVMKLRKRQERTKADQFCKHDEESSLNASHVAFAEGPC